MAKEKGYIEERRPIRRTMMFPLLYGSKWKGHIDEH